MLRLGLLWYRFDDLGLALDLTGLALPRSRAEGLLVRAAMSYNHFRKRAEEERKRGR